MRAHVVRTDAYANYAKTRILNARKQHMTLAQIHVIPGSPMRKASDYSATQAHQLKIIIQEICTANGGKRIMYNQRPLVQLKRNQFWYNADRSAPCKVDLDRKTISRKKSHKGITKRF